MTVVAGVDVGNATTEVAFLDGDRLLGVDRVPTRGRKGSEDSLRGAAALVRRLERRLGCRVAEALVAPLRAVDTTTMTIPPAPPDTGRLRLLTAGVATPGGSGACDRGAALAGPPAAARLGSRAAEARAAGPAAGTGSFVARSQAVAGPTGATGSRAERPLPWTRWDGVTVTPAGTRTTGHPLPGRPPWPSFRPGSATPARPNICGHCSAAGVPVGAVLAGGDEGVLIFNRLSAALPVIDQVDLTAVAGCDLVAVEVRPPGYPLTLLADPVALADAFSLAAGEAADAALLCRTLVDFSNAVVGRAAGGGASAPAGPGGPGGPDPGVPGSGVAGVGDPGWATGRAAPGRAIPGRAKLRAGRSRAG